MSAGIPFAHLGPSTRIPSRSRFVHPERIWIGDYVMMEENIAFDTANLVFNEEPDPLRIRIGDCTTIGRHCLISANNRVEIGSHVLFAQNVYVSDNGHHFEDVGIPIRYQYHSGYRGSVRIEDGCWLGRNVVVVGSRRPITIGTGSVIGANAVVTFDVPAYAVVTGNPGRISRLYDPETDNFVRVRTPEDIARVMANRERLGTPPRPARVDLGRFHHMLSPLEVEGAQGVILGVLAEAPDGTWRRWMEAFLRTFGPEAPVTLVLGVNKQGAWEETLDALSQAYEALANGHETPLVIIQPFDEGERPRFLRSLKACAIDADHPLGELRCLEVMACGVSPLALGAGRIERWITDGETGLLGMEAEALLIKAATSSDLERMGLHARALLEDAFGVPHVGVGESGMYFTPPSDRLGQ